MSRNNSTNLLNIFPKEQRRPLHRDPDYINIVTRAQSGDNEAIMRMIASVHHSTYAAAMSAASINKHNDVEDYIYAAIASLINGGIQKFSLARGISWHTYAKWWIRAGAGKLRYEGKVFVNKAYRDPKRFASYLEDKKITASEFWEQQQTVSIDAPVSESDGDVKVSDRMSSDAHAEMENDVLKSQQFALIKSVLATKDPLHVKMFELYYIEELSLKEIVKRLKVKLSDEAVRCRIVAIVKDIKAYARAAEA